MIYVVYFSDLGAPKTGLSPTLDLFIKVSDGTSAGTPPAVNELSGGFYKFTYSPSEDVAIRVDSNDAAMADRDRYIPIEASPHDDDLDAAVSDVKTQTDKMNFTGDDIKATLGGEKVALSDATEEQIDAIEGIGFPKTKKLETGEASNVEGINIYGDYLYGNINVSPGKVVKVALPDFRLVDTITFGAGENAAFGENCIVGGYLYVACWSGHLKKIDLNTFTVADTITLSVSLTTTVLADEDDNFLYVIVYDSPGKILKIDIATFTEVDSLTLASGEDDPYGAGIKNTKLYVGCQTTPGKIVKIDLETFIIETTLALSGGNNNITSLVIDVNHIYAGLDMYPGRVVKIDVTSFTEIITLILNTGENCIESITKNENNIYVCPYSNPTKVIVIDADTFIRLFEWSNETSYKQPERNPIISNQFIYIPCHYGKLLGIPLSIWQHTNEMQGKLPTNNIMGSAVKTDKDDEIDRILTATEIRQFTIDDAAATTTKFITTLTETSNTFWPRAALLMTSGQNKGIIRGIKTYNGSTKEIQIQTPLSYAPANGDKAIILPARKFLTPDIVEFREEMDANSTKLAFLAAIEGGRWKIISNQMIFYKEDNITEVARFNLLDKDGQPAEKNVMERTRV